MRGVRAVGGDQAAAFVIENIQRTQKEISTRDLIPPPPPREASAIAMWISFDVFDYLNQNSKELIE